IISKQRERLDKTPTSRNDLRPLARQQVDHSKILIQLHGISRTDDVDSTDELYPPGHGGQSRQHNFRSRNGVIFPVMLSQSYRIYPQLIREFDLLDELDVLF